MLNNLIVLEKSFMIWFKMGKENFIFLTSSIEKLFCFCGLNETFCLFKSSLKQPVVLVQRTSTPNRATEQRTLSQGAFIKDTKSLSLSDLNTRQWHHYSYKMAFHFKV